MKDLETTPSLFICKNNNLHTKEKREAKCLDNGVRFITKLNTVN